MKNRKLSLVFALFLTLGWINTLLGQASSSVGIALSEYCVSNTGFAGTPQPDYYGNLSDWIELKSNFTSSVSMNGYYLSNDPNNLYKWPFPANFIMGPGVYKTIWLTGKNRVAPNGEVHASFSIDQCKNQTLYLSNAQGVIRDQVTIKRTKEGHSRGRISYVNVGDGEWRVFTTPTMGSANVGLSYVDYSPRPIIRSSLEPILPNPVAVNAGGFYPTGDATPQPIYIYLENGIPYDTTTTCFRIYYTVNTGFYPVPGGVGTVKLLDTMPVTSVDPATVIRAISVPYSTGGPPNPPTGCELDYLPSFCETNTYFTNQKYNEFTPEFGVLSYSMDEADTSWFSGNGATKPIIHVEYYDGKNQVSEGYTQIDRPINEEWLTKQKGFYMTIDDRRGFGCNFEGNIFNVEGLGTTDRKIFPTLHLKAGDYESHSVAGPLPSAGTGIMDVFYQSLAAKNNLNVNPLHVKPVIVFKNGKYQGVYDLRETYDKHYENYYNKQSMDSLDMMYHHQGTDGALTYFDGPNSNFSMGPSFASANSFANTVYTLGVSLTISNPLNYNKLFSRLDKESFIDYMILNSYAMNSNLWRHDIAFARGGEPSKPGNKWHYYLWNLPSIFNFTALSLPNSPPYYDVFVSPCYVHTLTANAQLTSSRGNSHGNILNNLMQPATVGSTRYAFQQEYKNRYQDLLNGPLRCDNILKHYDYVKNLFLKEMTYMEDNATVPVAGQYLATTLFEWDSNTVIIRRGIEKRCKVMSEGFGKKFANCYGMQGPFALTVDVEPAGAGTVKLNSLTLDSYIWSGSYYATTLSFKATPVDDSYAFDHWEFQNHTPLNSAPLSLDSVAIGFNQTDNVIAVFTDKKNDISMPTGFTPNGDGINDVFRPLGSAKYSHEFDLSVWNRWGQEVFRSTDPTVGWDGNYRGQGAQTGVYAYVITYKNVFNESKILKGNLTLVR